MTTKVTVDAHAGWDIEVKTVFGEQSQEKVEKIVIVPRKTVQDFYIHSGMYIASIKEIVQT